MRPDDSVACSAPNVFIGCRQTLLERFPFEIGTDGHDAFDPAINAETMSSS
jgi:hypothetical protein